MVNWIVGVQILPPESSFRVTIGIFGGGSVCGIRVEPIQKFEDARVSTRGTEPSAVAPDATVNMSDNAVFTKDNRFLTTGGHLFDAAVVQPWD